MNRKRRSQAQIEADALRTGRPELGKKARKFNLCIRLSAEEMTDWKRAANAEGMALGAWIAAPRRAEWERKKGGL